MVCDGGQAAIGTTSSMVRVGVGGAWRQIVLDEDPVDVLLVPSSPWPGAVQQPAALVVLLPARVEVYDMAGEALVPARLEHALDIHTSMTTAVLAVPHCGPELHAALMWAAAHRAAPPRRPWCASGGAASQPARGDWTLVITGHADGSVRFWQAGPGACVLLLLVSDSVQTRPECCCCTTNQPRH